MTLETGRLGCLKRCTPIARIPAGIVCWLIKVAAVLFVPCCIHGSRDVVALHSRSVVLLAYGRRSWAGHCFWGKMWPVARWVLSVYLSRHTFLGKC